MAAILISAAGHVTASPADYVPVPVDYDNPAMWYIADDDSLAAGADVFYIPATWEFDWLTADSLVSHYADPTIAKHREHMAREMKGFAEMMGAGNRFYSPYYRHITLDTWATLDESYIDSCYFNVAFRDIAAAFDNYLRHRYSRRPFVLAGFSQGAKSVVELMKIMPDSVRDNMVAAYVIGYKVTPADTAACRYIIPADNAYDTGVTVCYNSVQAPQYTKPLISVPNVACINPVNWSTAPVAAVLNDSVTVTLDSDLKVLVVSGYDASKYKPILGILNTGDLPSADPWLYSDQLRRNVKDRIARWKQKH